MEIIMFAYFLANCFFLGYLAYFFEVSDDLKVYHLIFGLMFLPTTLVFVLVYVAVLIGEKISDSFPKSRLGKILNKKVF